MIMGLGGGGGGTDSDDDQSDEDGVPPEQTTLLDGDTEDTTEDTSDGGSAAGTAAAGAAGAAGGSSGGASGGGTGAGVGSGGPSGGGSGGSSGGAGPGEDTEEEGEEGDETDEETIPENDSPSGPTEEPESDTDDLDQDSEDSQDTEDNTEDDKEDEVPQDAELVVYTDAWDFVGWGIEPVLKKLEVEFGISFDLSYEPLDPRKLDKAGWEVAADQYEMPYGDFDDLPATTELSTKALNVAQDENQDLFRDYLRRLRIAALIEGINIEDREQLIDLAEDVGFDAAQFEEIWLETSVDDTTEYQETPVMWATVGDYELPWSGDLSYEHAYFVLLDNNVLPVGVTTTPTELVAEYEPMTTVEAEKVLGFDKDELQQAETIEETEIGSVTFWTTQ